MLQTSVLRYCYVIIEPTPVNSFSRLICATTSPKRVKELFVDYVNAYQRFPLIYISDRTNDISRRITILELDDNLSEEIQVTSNYTSYCWIVNVITPYGYVVGIIHEPDRMKRIPGATRMYGPFRIDMETTIQTQIAIDALLSLLSSP